MTTLANYAKLAFDHAEAIPMDQIETGDGPASLEHQDYDFDIAAEEVASERGQVVVLPLPNQLQIDLDSESALRECERRVSLMGMENSDGQLGANPRVEIRESASGAPHYHATITFHRGKVFDEWERIAMQAALGDDPVRVYLNAKRKLFGTANPSRFFEKKP